MDQKILVIEDEADIQNLVVLTLQSEGYQVESAFDGAIGYQMLQKNTYDLIVLDVMLPGMDGLSVCSQLRRDQNFTPILMLTARKTETDRVVGLEMGADDYLTKPFSVRELQARVKALLRRASFHQSTQELTKDNACLQIDELFIDRQKRTVKRADKPISLTAKEFDLLNYLIASPGKVFTRNQLLSGVWGYQFSGYEHTVNSHINRLRSKIEDNPAQPDYVLTVWGVGYKFRD